jgi:hypothetical protein
MVGVEAYGSRSMESGGAWPHESGSLALCGHE